MCCAAMLCCLEAPFFCPVSSFCAALRLSYLFILFRARRCSAELPVRSLAFLFVSCCFFFCLLPCSAVMCSIIYQFPCCCCRAALCYAMLCCAVLSLFLSCILSLCCAVLCCAVPCCAVPCRAVPCFAAMCCAVPCRAVPRCALLCCAVLCCTVPCYCTCLLYTSPSPRD